MGGGKGDDTPSYDPAAGQAYLQTNPDVAASGMDPYRHYTQHGQAEGRVWGAPSWMDMMPQFSMPDMSALSQPAYEAPDFAAQQAELEKQQGTRDRDTLYSEYMDAASSSADFINNQITQERSRARLMGVDYSINEEQKNQRVSDYFASVWGEGQQTQLEQLFDKWGAPEGFEGFSIERGDASKFGGRPGTETGAGQTGGTKPKAVIDQDDEQTLGTQSVLGV